MIRRLGDSEIETNLIVVVDTIAIQNVVVCRAGTIPDRWQIHPREESKVGADGAERNQQYLRPHRYSKGVSQARVHVTLSHAHVGDEMHGWRPSTP
jgi:hypothetical protein